MAPQIVGVLAFGTLLGLGAVEQSNWLIGAGGVGMTVLQFIVMGMLQPIRDKLAKLETKIAVIEARCCLYYESTHSQHRHQTPRPTDDTPL